MDNTQSITERKNRWRRADSVKKRQERAIVGYMEIKYPNIYKEAVGFFNQLREKYPNKLDLRKTNEYDLLRMPAKRIRKHTTTEVVYQKTKKTVEVEDNMQLRIRLFSPEQVAETPNEEPTTETPNEEPTTETPNGGPTTETPNEGPTTETPNEEPTTETSDEMANQDPTIQPVETTIGETDTLDSTLNSAIPEAVIAQILETLREDPFLDSYFMDIDECCPLEEELINW